VSAELGGGGNTSLVYQERCDATGETVAVKYLPRAELKVEGIARELHTHAQAVHQHIAGFRECLLMPEWVAIVEELCEGHNLLAWLNQQPERRASEAVARGIITQILAAVQHMHTCVGMVHRDLKVRALRRRRALGAACAATEKKCLGRQHLPGAPVRARRGACAENHRLWHCEADPGAPPALNASIGTSRVA
jgi:serine/threonine protein kinase